MADLKWPSAVLPLSGGELVPLLQGNKVLGAPVSAFGSGGGGGGNITVVSSYAAIRAGVFNPTAPMFLDDPTKPGVFIAQTTGFGSITDNGGTRIKDAGGTTWAREVESRVNAAWFYNAGGTHYLGDNTAVAITLADQNANPQWIGMPNGSGNYPVGTYWDYVALQEWIYALAADASVPGTVHWNINAPTKNRAGWCPRGNMWINQPLYIFGVGLNIEFSSRGGTQINWNGNATGTSNVGPAILMDSIAFSKIDNLNLADNKGVSNYLISIDHSPSSPMPLSPQANTFTNWQIGGGWASGPNTVMTECAIAIAPVGGGAAQCDTQLFIHPFFINFMYDGIQLSGSNIVAMTVIGGNFQGCVRNGIKSFIGGFAAYETIMESGAQNFFMFPQQTQISLDGADFYTQSGYGASDNNTIMGIRSESYVSVVDVVHATLLMNSAVNGGISNYTPSTGQHALPGYLLGTGLATPYTTVMLVDDGGWPWFLSDPSSTTTHIINPGSPGWTTNQWVGYVCWLRFASTGTCNTSAIIASDANSITVAGALSAGAHYIKIGGVSGSTMPNWASATRMGRTIRGTPGYGFTTTAGSNSVQAGAIMGAGAFAQVGDWVCIPGAQDFAPAGQTAWHGPLLGKIATFDGVNTITIVDSRGNPQNATVNATDLFGYWGQGVTDGNVTWMPTMWDVIYGVKKGIGISVPIGYASSCGELELDGPPTQGRGGNFIREITPSPVGNNYTERLSPPVWLAPAYSLVTSSPLNITANAGFGGVGASQSLSFLINIAAVTVNLPAMSLNTIEEFDLIFYNNVGGTPAIITWGTNIKSASPTLSLGTAASTTTIVHMKWIGTRSNPTFPSTWYVMNVTGPV